MMIPTHRVTAADSAKGLLVDRALCQRVHGEYGEMPGLRLTLAQASRLFNLDMTHCSQVLDALVTQGALWTNGREFLASNGSRRSA